MQENVLEVVGLTKKYPGVLALNNVSMSFRKGEVHAIAGENGAGKSTLIKAITGAIQPTEGVIRIDGKEFKSLTPSASKEQGIGVIYQEFSLIPALSVAENIFLGQKVGSGRLVNKKEMERQASIAMDDIGAHVDPRCAVKTLPVGQQQLVEICKAIVKADVKVLIMDEPSAPLSTAEIEQMFSVVRRFNEKGVTIIYISHRMDEIFEISDRVSVMRDGEYVGTVNTAETNRQELIKMMVGRELKEEFPKRTKELGEEILRVEHLSGNGVEDISFTLRRGEILGFAGLLGCGRTECMELVCGAAKKTGGTIYVDQKPLTQGGTENAMKNGIAIVPEDRKRHGVFLRNDIQWNIGISCIKKYAKHGLIDFKREEIIAGEMREDLQIKAPTLAQKVGNLSGGNQQKVVIAKALATKPSVLIFDEPTRGIDVGAKQEIYKIMRRLADEGNSILMVSSEMEEVIGMSDRIIVLAGGRVTAELQKEDFSQTTILNYASQAENRHIEAEE